LNLGCWVDDHDFVRSSGRRVSGFRTELFEQHARFLPVISKPDLLSASEAA
jgi:hypothetical protein